MAGGAAARVGAAQGEHDLGGVVDVGVVVVIELERPAARLQAGAADLPVAGAGISSSSSQSAALVSAGCSAGRPASASAMTASTVSHTGDWQASSRRTGPPGSPLDREPVQPGQPALDDRMVEAVAEQVQGDQ